MRCVLPLIVLLSLAFAPAPLPRAKKPDNRPDLEKMQGEWVLVSATTGGKRAHGNVLQGIIFSGGRFRMIGPVGYPGDWTYIMNVKAKPKALDMLTPGGSVLIKAIYSLEGDTLRICSHATLANQRPSDISGRGNSDVLWVFHRKQP